MLMPMISCEATSFAVSFTCVRVSVWERARVHNSRELSSSTVVRCGIQILWICMFVCVCVLFNVYNVYVFER